MGPARHLARNKGCNTDIPQRNTTCNIEALGKEDCKKITVNGEVNSTSD
jgi:hypothetical protein